MIIPQHFYAPSTLYARATNDNGTTNSNLSDGAIIVIVLVAAGFAVLLGYSTTRFFYKRDDNDHLTTNDEQARYMREVRQRSHRNLGVPSDFHQHRPRYDDQSTHGVEEDGRSSYATKETVYSP